MKRKWMPVALLSTTVLLAALFVRLAVATPASVGFSAATLALGRLGDVNAVNQLISQGTPPWLSVQFVKGASDLYVQSNVWQAGGSTGWHSHPGHSLIIVTAGSLSDYESSDPDCKPKIYTKGMAFVDEGGDHVHNIVNESNAVATNIAVQLVPADAQRRVDAPQPSNCPSFPPF